MKPRVKRVLWGANDLKDVEIPDEAKRYLQDVGLPDVADSSQRFAAHGLDSEGNLIVGVDYGEPVLVERGSGRVYVVQALTSSDGVSIARRRKLLANSSVALFSEFVELYEGFRQDPRVEADAEHARQAFERIERQMQERDAVAFLPELAGTEDTMWRQLLNDIRWQLDE